MADQQGDLELLPADKGAHFQVTLPLV